MKSFRLDRSATTRPMVMAAAWAAAGAGFAVLGFRFALLALRDPPFHPDDPNPGHWTRSLWATAAVGAACGAVLRAAVVFRPRLPSAEPRARRWWRKKRWLAAAVLLLAVSYPASEGPAWYVMYRAVRRGHPVALTVYASIYRPLHSPLGYRYLGRPFLRYRYWWDALAREHEGEPRPPLPVPLR